jgi:hypothetical protein
MTERDPDAMRMLGTRDGLSFALVWVRNQISSIDGRYSPRIDPRHKHKRAARDAVLRPLKELESRIAESHAGTVAAYKRMTGGDGEQAPRDPTK